MVYNDTRGKYHWVHNNLSRLSSHKEREILTEHYSYYLSRHDVSHRLAAGRAGWCVHGLCKSLKDLEKPLLLRRVCKHSAIFGIIVCRCRWPHPWTQHLSRCPHSVNREVIQKDFLCTAGENHTDWEHWESLSSQLICSFYPPARTLILYLSHNCCESSSPVLWSAAMQEDKCQQLDAHRDSYAVV